MEWGVNFRLQGWVSSRIYGEHKKLSKKIRGISNAVARRLMIFCREGDEVVFKEE